MHFARPPGARVAFDRLPELYYNYGIIPGKDDEQEE